MRTYDVRCNECGYEDEQFLHDSEENFKPCVECGGSVQRIFTKMTFKLIDDVKTQMVGWAHNNYNKNMYWEEFKKERYEKGRDVRPPDEDP